MHGELTAMSSLSQKCLARRVTPAYFDPQTEKAFMRQPGVFLNSKKGNKSKTRVAR